jgi:TolB-like protein
MDEAGQAETPRSAQAPEQLRRVFISYASHDAAIAQKVCSALETAGFLCWIAPRNVVPGTLYADGIVHAIDDSSILVLILSEQAVESAHVGREIERAISKRHAVIALRIDGAPLTAAFEYFLNQSQWIECGGSDAAISQLVSAVGQHLAPGSPTLPTSANQASAVHRKAAMPRRVWVIAAVVVALALAGAYFVDKAWRSKHATIASAAVIGDKSIAVLPFVDMSEKKDQEYFSDGLSEELIDLLTKVPELKVPARTSSFYFKGKQVTIADIAKALGVVHVLEGSVRKSGNTLRITAQLIRVDNGYHVWSESYDRKVDDIFKIQDEIADAVVAALKVRLLPAQQPSARNEQHTENLEAYTLYLQGRQSYNQADIPGYQHAVTAFRAATTLDPQYAAAYAELALAQFWLTDDTYAGEAADVAGYESALAAAEKAVALAPGMAAGYSARGFLRAVYRFDFAGGQEDLVKAVGLSPGDAMVLHRSAVLLGVLGDLPAAIAREQQALALNPLSEEICRRLAFFFQANQQFAQARTLYEKALVIAPNSAHARFNLGELSLLENQPELALARFRQTGLEVYSLSGLAKAEYSLKHVDASRRALETLSLKYGKASPWSIAEVYAWRGEKDRAFEWAERAYSQRDDGITWIKIDIDFRGLRDDPRYIALLKKMNLPSD